jgi:1-acyl-sn-glycerol-3-phosphate acyltransferase
MIEAFDRTWRCVATGLCFAAFGIGGLLMRLLVFPLLRVAVRDPRQRALLARTVIRHSFGGFVGAMSLLGVMTVEVRGAERLRRGGLLILANHPSLIDVVLLMMLVERADCIVKSALARNPFTRGPVCAAGFVCNDSGAELIEDCVRSIRAGDNLIIFPEGTRTARDGVLRLQRGAANVAVRGGIDITPVRIRVTPRTLTKGEKWYRVPAQRPHFEVEVDADIPVQAFAVAGAGEAIAARRLTDHLTDYFSRWTRAAA